MAIGAYAGRQPVHGADTRGRFDRALRQETQGEMNIMRVARAWDDCIHFLDAKEK